NHTRLLAQLAQELGARPAQVSAAVELLDSGATVPFIARYRKEVTGGLDDTVLRNLEVRLEYLRDLQSRRASILQSIFEQGKLTVELQQAIETADSKQRLEDLYAPYKPKRRTRAQIAREAGLEPLADTLLTDDQADPQTVAAGYVNAEAGVADVKAALDGARDILAERFAEDADLLANLRDHLWSTALLYSKVSDGKEAEGANFRDWFDFSEPLRTLPSHRVLALLRGRQQGILELRIGLETELEALSPHPCVARVATLCGIRGPLFGVDADPRQKWPGEVCRWTWRVKLLPGFDTELIG
nr:RNA-binding transcriptional accessory protein [Pseudomonas sp.]